MAVYWPGKYTAGSEYGLSPGTATGKAGSGKAGKARPVTPSTSRTSISQPKTSSFRRPSGGISGQRGVPTLSGSAGIGASSGFFRGGGGGGGMVASSPFFAPSATSAPSAPSAVGAGNRLANIIFQKNKAAEAEQVKRDQEQAALNRQAYESGLMSDEEYQALESKGFETTRAQFGQVGREFGETAYGRVNTGALRAGARDIKLREAEAIGGGVRELGLERLRRKSEASRIYSQAEQTRQSQFQIPRYDIPDTFGQTQQATAIAGPTAPSTGGGGGVYTGGSSSFDERTGKYRPPSPLSRIS